MTIWLLSFQIKRNPFTVLILNLAIADFGFLLCMAIYYIHCSRFFMPPGIPHIVFFSIFCTMHIHVLFLLTAISIGQCVSVLFSKHHHCSCPKYLSPAFCAWIWICSLLLSGIPNIREYRYNTYNVLCSFYLVVIAVLCLPLTTISAVILFIKICLKSKQIRRGRRLMTLINLTLTLPLYIYMFIVHCLGMNYILRTFQFAFYFSLSACLNSTFKPGIYFLVGRKKGAQSRQSIKVMFERVFREDEAPETR